MSADPAPVIRRATAADAAALALVASATFLDSYAHALLGSDIAAHCAIHNTPDKFTAWITDPANAVMLVEAAPNMGGIGYSVLTTPDLPIALTKGDIELRRIYVLSRYHGRGLGTALIAQARNDARAMGFSRMVLGVWGENHAAHRFYEHCGFAVAGRRSFTVGTTTHDDLVYAMRV